MKYKFIIREDYKELLNILYKIIITIAIPVLTIIISIFQCNSSQKQEELAFVNHWYQNPDFKKDIDKYYREHITTHQIYEKLYGQIEFGKRIESESISMNNLKCNNTNSKYLFMGSYNFINNSWYNVESNDIVKLVLKENNNALNTKINDLIMMINNINGIHPDNYSGIIKGYPVSDYRDCENVMMTQENQYISFPDKKDRDTRIIKRNDNNYDIWVKIK